MEGGYNMVSNMYLYVCPFDIERIYLCNLTYVLMLTAGRVVNVEDGKDTALSESLPDKTQAISIIFTIYTV